MIRVKGLGLLRYPVGDSNMSTTKNVTHSLQEQQEQLHEPSSKFLTGGYVGDYIGVIKGQTLNPKP